MIQQGQEDSRIREQPRSVGAKFTEVRMGRQFALDVAFRLRQAYRADAGISGLAGFFHHERLDRGAELVVFWVKNGGRIAEWRPGRGKVDRRLPVIRIMYIM